MLVEDLAGKEWPEGAAEPRILDADVHFRLKAVPQIQPARACPVCLYTPLAMATETSLDLSGTMM